MQAFSKKPSLCLKRWHIICTPQLRPGFHHKVLQEAPQEEQNVFLFISNMKVIFLSHEYLEV